MSEKISIYSALSKFHEAVGKISKDSVNPHFKSRYSDIDTVLETIREPLKKAGLCFTQLPQQGGMKTIISTLDGESQIESFVEYVLDKNNMQGLGSAITYSRRYALVSMLGLEAEDDDGNTASQPKPKQPENKAQEDERMVKYKELVSKTMKHYAMTKENAQGLLNASGVKFELTSVTSALNDFDGLIAHMETIRNQGA